MCSPDAHQTGTCSYGIVGILVPKAFYAAQVPEGERLEVTYVTMVPRRELDSASPCHTPCIPAGARFHRKLTCALARCTFMLPGCSHHPARDVSLCYWTDFTHASERGLARVFPKHSTQCLVPFGEPWLHT